MQKNCNVVVTNLMIMWSSIWSRIWSSNWSNTWPTNLIFLKANKPYLYYYYKICHHQLANFVISCRHYWLATLVVRHCYYYYYGQYLFQEVLWLLIKLSSLYISSYYLLTPFYIWWLSTKANPCHQRSYG